MKRTRRLKMMLEAWRRRSGFERRLFVEAFFRLGLARAALLLRPFRRIAAHMAVHSAAEEVHCLRREGPEDSSIGWAVRTAARYTPWQSACLAQALAAQKMLEARDISGVMHLGLAREKESGGELKAHAWLESGAGILTGGETRHDFTVVASFSWPGAGRRGRS